MAESCVFGKQSLGPIRCGRPPLGEQVPSRTRRHPFSRSCGAIMPSSLTAVPPIASVCSTRPPVSVLVRAPAALAARFFWGAWVRRLRSRSFVSRLGLRGWRTSLPAGLPAFTGASRTPRACPSPSPLVSTRRGRYGNVRPLRIGYAFRPRLSPRLTLGGLASPRKPWACGGGVSRAPLATHASILAPMPSTGGRPSRFAPHGTLPYRRKETFRPAASAPCLAPCIVGALPLDQ